MKKSYLISVVVLLLCISISLADEVAFNIDYANVSNPVIEASVFTDVTDTFNFTITNTGNYTIKYFNFSNIPNVLFKPEANIAIGNKAKVNFTVLTNTTFDQTLVSTVSAIYLVPYVADMNIVIINITQTGFVPRNITVYQDRTTIIWQNVDTITHNIATISGPAVFDTSIPSNNQYQQTISGIGTLRYYDKTTGYSAELYVANKNLLVEAHNPSKDKMVNLRIISKYRPSDVLLDIFTQNLSCAVNDKVEGVLRVINNYNETAYGLHLEAPDTIFLTNDFSLNKSDQKIVNFIITPTGLTQNNQTGKAYEYAIKVVGLNVAPVQKVLSLYIKPFDFSINQTSNCIDWEGKKKFCLEYPSSIYCTNDPIIINQTEIVYKYPEFTVNISQDEFDALKTTCIGTQEIPTRVENKVKEFVYTQEDIRGFMRSVNESLFEYKNETKQLRKDVNAMNITKIVTTILLFLGIIVFVVALGLGVWYYGYSKKQKFYKG